MKTLRFLSSLAVIFSMLVFTQCGGHDDPDTVSLSQHNIDFEANIEDAEPIKIFVTTNLDNWDVAYISEPSWVNAVKSDKETLSVTVFRDNAKNEPRPAEIRIKAGSAYDTLRVTQKAKIKDNISLSPLSPLIFQASETGEKSVTVTTNAPSWSASKPGDVSWLSIEQVSGSNMLMVRIPSANTQITSREANITFTGGDADPVTYTIKQEAAAPYISVTPSSYNFGAEETATKTINVSTNIADWNGTAGSSFIHITLNKSNNTATVSVDKNTTTVARDGIITFTAGSAPPATVKITQNPIVHTLDVNPKSLSFTANETASRTLTITTNAPSWNSSKSANWIIATMYPSTNTIVVTVENNTGTSARSGTITVTAGTAPSVTVNVTQSGISQPSPTLSVTPTSLSIGADDTSQKTLTVTTNQSSWNASASVSWITTTKSGNTLLVKATSNTGALSRSGSITFTAGSATPVTVSVTQPAPPQGPCFGYVPNSTYYATGTPSLALDPGPGSWSGSLTLSCSGQWYSITNWAGTGRMVFCDYINNKIVLDSDFKIVEGSNGVNGYFKAIIVDNNTLMWEEVPDFDVKYNSSTKVLDFSGTYKGHPVLVGIVGIEESTGDLLRVWGDAYSNTKLTLTPTTSSAPFSGNTVLKSDLKNAQAPVSLKMSSFEGNRVYKKTRK
jgi:hypothetical protein